MYQERPSTLDGAVVWTRAAGPGDRQARVLPDGCMDLIWSDGLLVAGPDTGAHLTSDRPGRSYAGLRFAPGTGAAVLGVPAHLLRDQRVPLAALWPERKVRELTERVAATADPGAALEALAAGRLREAELPGPWRRTAVAALRGGSSVAEVARRTGLSERQLHRRCLPVFGYGPKTLGRVLRLQRALRLARSGTGAAEVAAATGYADQAHLAREVRALAGVPLTALR
ncbi:AraC family transcriptional regulator [Streptomyces sp. ACA25]|uniref:helix-turn-helix domain-containing protein n=1 Tax=Streptomyces sp. ACA25 TaxID=3022596 RepID=UPI0023070D2E|nr:AraC family transcriptional regulator [Streptomyces sp. ACA25]MDB1086224.1 AraC family transcriptional regulator [Streptomyces sp. ACA25]